MCVCIVIYSISIIISVVERVQIRIMQAGSENIQSKYRTEYYAAEAGGSRQSTHYTRLTSYVRQRWSSVHAGWNVTAVSHGRDNYFNGVQ